MQLKSMCTPKIAMAFGTALFNNLQQAADKVKGYPGVSCGTMTPAARFPNTAVPECMRYTISNAVLQYEVTATDTEFAAMDEAKKQQARKRARLMGKI
jgi:hypothetical protein